MKRKSTNEFIDSDKFDFLKETNIWLIWFIIPFIVFFFLSLYIIFNRTKTEKTIAVYFFLLSCLCGGVRGAGRLEFIFHGTRYNSTIYIYVCVVYTINVHTLFPEHVLPVHPRHQFFWFSCFFFHFFLVCFVSSFYNLLINKRLCLFLHTHI